MSYVDLTPAYYAPLQWNLPFHPGAEGWLHAPVPPWGENPNNAWPKMQAAHGLGAAVGLGAAPPPVPVSAPGRFTYVGSSPFPMYIQQGISPWGRVPTGGAYAAPRPLACKGCIGMPIRPGIGSVVAASRAINAGNLPAAVQALKAPAQAGLGASCGPCEISAGDRCVPCPNGSDLPECADCQDGRSTLSPAWHERPIVGTVVLGVVTAVATGIAMSFLKKQRVPVG